MELGFYQAVTNAATTYISASDEYCLKGLEQTWRYCMTKTEWSGWAQVIGVLFGLLIAIFVPFFERRHARRLARRATDEEKYKYRRIATALVNRYGQTLINTMNVYVQRKGFYLLETKGMRASLQCQLNQFNSLPLNSVTAEEQKYLALIQDIGIQLLEILLFAESFNAKNADDEYIILDAMHHMVCGWVSERTPDAIKNVEELKKIWGEENVRLFGPKILTSSFM